MKTSSYFLLAVAVAISTRFIDYQANFTWCVWCLSILMQRMDRCYLKNPLIETLFEALERRDLDKSVKIPATPVTIIEAKDYSYRALELLSQSWTQPVIVRGLFADAPALQKWTDPDYLISRTFDNSSVSVIHNGTIVKHYEMVCGPEDQAENFSEYKRFDEVIHRITKGSTETIVFPPASRSKRIRDK